MFEKDETKNDFFIRFALSHPGITSSVVGTRSLKHFTSNIKAMQKGPLSPEIYEEAKERLNFVGVIPGPVNMKLDW